jgi:hypothetical protein
MCRSRRTRTGSQAISCRYRMAPHPAPCAPVDATCRQPLSPRMIAGAVLRRYPGEHQVLYPAELKSAYFLMISAYVPRPIALVSSLSAAGVGNVAPYSYSGCIAHDPPTLVVSCCRRPDGRSPAGVCGLVRVRGLQLRNGSLVELTRCAPNQCQGHVRKRAGHEGVCRQHHV